jgi:hypothetical protein
MFKHYRRILCIRSMYDPRFKTIQDTSPEFTEDMIDMNSVFVFELLTSNFRCSRRFQDDKRALFIPGKKKLLVT